MTDFDVPITKKGAVISDESPSLLQAWWKNWNLRYDLVMSSIILILNISAIVYMIAHKIPFEPLILPSYLSTMVYVISGMTSCRFWFEAIKNDSVSEFYFFGRISHAGGFFNFFVLFHSISPHLALYTALPFWLIWFVPFMIAPASPSIYAVVNNVRDWWKHVNQPQLRKTLLV